jgi:hypothetical protein
MTIARRNIQHADRADDLPDFLMLKGAAWLKLSKGAREHVVEQSFRYWREHGFPYYRLTGKQVRQEFARVLEHDWKRVHRNGCLVSSNVGLRLANAYQRGMWTARVSRYLSPMRVFKDDEMLRRAIRRAFTIWPTRYSANASSLRRMLKTFSGAASVSNYRPTIARAVISKYSPEGGDVLDFAAGYGGRFAGALAAQRSYIGIEPNRAQIRGFQRMKAAIRAQGFGLPSARFIEGAAETQLPKLPPQCTDLVFSSPPFFDWERYSNGKNQSFKRYPSYDEWQFKFLRPVLANSFRVLRKKGYMVINVTDGNRRPTLAEIQDLARICGFRSVTRHPMIFPKIPYLHPRDGNPVKQEVLMVFRKC